MKEETFWTIICVSMTVNLILGFLLLWDVVMFIELALEGPLGNLLR